MMRYMKWAALATVVVGLRAQVPDQIRQAAITGSRGTSGKCTIEVRVDIAAEVDVYGNSGRLRTLAGQPAAWVRMECSDPLPYNMSEFRFKGVDGRGQVKLVQDPRSNNGMAVIRIDDPRSGAEGYTFDIEWSGASGGSPSGFQTGVPSAPGGVVGSPGLPGRRPGRRGISAERAIELCRTELRTRAQRDYNLQNVDITAAAVDTNAGRSDWVTGTFTDRTGYFRRSGAYRFNCAVDYSSGQLRAMEILRADGTVVQPRSSTSGTPYNQPAYDQTRVLRACQDAVVARTGRDGYQNVNFASIVVDSNRAGWVTGVLTGSRGPVNDTFDFGCAMDLGAATVRNVELKRR